MGNTFFFLVDFIIAQNLEKVKFWKMGRGKKGRGEGRERRKGGGRETAQNRKIGHVGKGGGVAVWRFQFLPFARKATPVFDFDFL